jgi:hypothetical protein
MEENKLPYIERKEERQQRKDQKRREMQSGRSMRVFRTYAILILAVAAAGYGVYFLLQSTAPKGKDFSRAIPLMEAVHVTVGSQLPEYTSNPPTSGPHYGKTARSGFRNEVISDQNIIHNLEHGDVWIAYHPRIGDAVQEELKQFGAAKVIITPREANETDIALAAWGRLDAFNIENGVLPVERIGDFIKRYANKGPEKVPGASSGI